MRIIVDGFGKTVAKRDNQIVIKENGKEEDYFVIDEISQILITGKGSITFDAMSLLAEHEVDCVSINWKGHVDYRLSAPDRKNAIVRKEQYFALADERSGHLAKAFIKAKIENQRAFLGTLAKSREDNDLILRGRYNLTSHLERLEGIPDGKSDDVRSSIMGIEGLSSAEYWSAISHVVDEKWGFANRSGRYATDPINSLLNYGYAVLESEIWKSIYLAGLDPYCGFLHSERYGRASLVFDLIEEFRQQVVDKTVLSIVNKKSVSLEDFEFSNNAVIIKDKARRLIISKILDKLGSKIQFNGSNRSYFDIIEYQGRQIANYLTNSQDYIGFSLRW
ncbi:CRISPR-associated endonuclease Cas1 [uncultured Methanobrevibacter sp.]|uniref:CRISPR-associated endonuclease Cas1 n=1 Tax=uncultured Methanobrevibacter sp. TaxID=253161 RepID=UPI002618EE2C